VVSRLKCGHARLFTIKIGRASYTVRIPMDKYYVLDGSEKLAVFCSRFCQIQVEMETKNVVCSPYSYPNPNMLTCWQEKLVSNYVTTAVSLR
jgi:hypothetical protein